MTDGGSDHIEFLGSFEALDDPRPAGEGTVSVTRNPVAVSVRSAWRGR